jgi:hypothetical protein
MLCEREHINKQHYFQLFPRSLSLLYSSHVFHTYSVPFNISSLSFLLVNPISNAVFRSVRLRWFTDLLKSVHSATQRFTVSYFASRPIRPSVESTNGTSGRGCFKQGRRYFFFFSFSCLLSTSLFMLVGICVCICDPNIEYRFMLVIPQSSEEDIISPSLDDGSQFHQT